MRDVEFTVLELLALSVRRGLCWLMLSGEEHVFHEPQVTDKRYAVARHILDVPSYA